MIFALAFTLAAAAPSGHIAFVSGPTAAQHCVHVADLSTGQSRRVGPGSYDQAPMWSPDGTHLVFETAHGDGSAIYVVSADGSKGTRLSDEHTWNRWPRWSPDGKRIAYTAGTGVDTVIRVHNLATGDESIWGGNARGLMRPVWFPGIVGVLMRHSGQEMIDKSARTLDGLITVGYAEGTDGLTTDLFVVTPGSVYPMPHAVLPSEGDYAEWFAEPHLGAKAIAFESNDGGDREVFLITERGAYDVSNHHTADWNPAWSPDGEWIAFESFRSGRRGIYRVHRDTIRIVPMAVSDDSANWSPAWSSDGRWLAFVSDRDGKESLYVTPFSGKGARRLVEIDNPVFAPAWRPSK